VNVGAVSAQVNPLTLDPVRLSSRIVASHVRRFDADQLTTVEATWRVTVGLAFMQLRIGGVRSVWEVST
jgi:hypothetical protein